MIWISFIGFSLFSIGLILIPFRASLFKASNPILILTLAASLPLLAYGLYVVLDDGQVPSPRDGLLSRMPSSA